MKQLASRVKEKYYRNINIPAGDLRISIVASCNMRCVYCHNEGQGDFRPKLLSLDSVRMIVSNSFKFGAKKVRLTGGEPLLHPEIFAICRMLKDELHVPSLGINTNGVLIDRLIPLVTEGLLDQVVIGIDFFDGPVSKNAPSGASSEQILRNARQLRELGQTVQLAAVYDGDYENIKKIVSWALDERILLKVLEVSDEVVSSEPTPEFSAMCERVISDFNLEVGITADLSEYYGFTQDQRKILFFHSHCRVRECSQCAHMHMRVTADGFAKPCILRKDTEFPLLAGNFDENMRRAIHNLGIPPEKTAA